MENLVMFDSSFRNSVSLNVLIDIVFRITLVLKIMCGQVW